MQLKKKRPESQQNRQRLKEGLPRKLKLLGSPQSRRPPESLQRPKLRESRPKKKQKLPD